MPQVSGRSQANTFANHISSSFDGTGFSQAQRAATTTEQSLRDFAKALAIRTAARPLLEVTKDIAKAVLNASDEFNKFEDQMRLVNTQAHLNERELADLRESVLSLSNTRQPIEEVTGSLFDLFSSLELADPVVPNAVAAMELLNKAADAGDAPVRQVTRSVVAMINTYGLDANIETFTRLLDIQFQLVEKGVVTYEELARTIGDVLPPAVAFGQSLNTVSGTLAFATRALANANKASISVARTFDLLSRSNVRDKLAEIGVQVVDNAGNFRQFGDIARDMVAAVEGMGDVEALDTLSEAFGRGDVRARRLLNAIIANGEGLQSLIEFTADSEGAMERALGERQRARAFRQAQAIAELGRQWTRFGGSVDGVVGSVQEFFTQGALKLLRFFNDLPGPVRAVALSLAGLAAALTGLVAIAGLAAAAFLSMRSLVVLSGFGSFTGLVNAATSAMTAFNTRLLFGGKLLAANGGLLAAFKMLLGQAASGALLLGARLVKMLFNPWTLAIAGLALLTKWLLDSRFSIEKAKEALDRLVESNARLKQAQVDNADAAAAVASAQRQVAESQEKINRVSRKGATDTGALADARVDLLRAEIDLHEAQQKQLEVVQALAAAERSQNDALGEFVNQLGKAQKSFGIIPNSVNKFRVQTAALVPELNAANLSAAQMEVILNSLSPSMRNAFKSMMDAAKGNLPGVEDMLTSMGQAYGSTLSLLVPGSARFAATQEEIASVFRALLIPTMKAGLISMDEVLVALSKTDPAFAAVARVILEDAVPAIDEATSKLDQAKGAAEKAGKSFADLGEDVVVFAGMTKKEFSDFQKETKQSLTDTTSVLETLAEKGNLTGDAIVGAFDRQRQALKDYANNWSVLLSKNPPQQLVRELQEMGLEGGGLVQSFASLNDREMKKIGRAYKGMNQDAASVTDSTMALVEGVNNLVASVQALVNEMRGIPPQITTTITVRQVNESLASAQDRRLGLSGGGGGSRGGRASDDAMKRTERKVVDQTRTVEQQAATSAAASKAADKASKTTEKLANAQRAASESILDALRDVSGRVGLSALSEARQGLDRLFEVLRDQDNFVPNSLIRRTRDLRRESKELEARWDSLSTRLENVRSAVDSAFSGLGVDRLADDLKDIIPTPQNIEQSLRDQGREARRFGRAIRDLSSRGFDDSVVLELTKRGPEAIPLIEAMADADPKKINNLFEAIDKQRRKVEKALIEDQLGPALRALKDDVKDFNRSLRRLTNQIRKHARRLDPGENNRFAEGIIARRPTFGLFGEAGPEALIPLSASKRARRFQLLRESGILEELSQMRRFQQGSVFGEPIRSSEGGARQVNLSITAPIRDPQELVREVEWSRETRGW